MSFNGSNLILGIFLVHSIAVADTSPAVAHSASTEPNTLVTSPSNVQIADTDSSSLAAAPSPTSISPVNIDDLRTEIEAKKQAAEDAQRKLDQERNEYNAAIANALAAQKAAASTIDELNRQLATAKQEIIASKQERGKVVTNLQETKTKVDELEKKIVETTATAATLQQSIDSVSNTSNYTSEHDEYEGDTIIFPNDRNAQIVDMRGKKPVEYDVCIPSRSKLVGTGKTRINGSNKNSPTTSAFVVTSLKNGGKCRDAEELQGIRMAYEDAIVIFDRYQFNNPRPTRIGLTYGTLVVPFKYHLANEHFSQSTSLGGYLGWRFSSPLYGIDWQTVVFCGGSTIPAKVMANNTADAAMLGLTGGLGTIITIKGQFHSGLVFGWDFVSGALDYKENKKVWVSAEIGYSFTKM